MPLDMTMLADLFYRQLEKIGIDSVDKRDKIPGLRPLLHLFFLELTQRERIHFSTSFARMAYAAQQYKLPGDLVFYLHHFRRKAARELREEEAEELFALGFKVVAEVVSAVTGVPPPGKLGRLIPRAWPEAYRPPAVQAFRRRVRALALTDDTDAGQLIAIEEEHPEKPVRVQYGMAHRNEDFNPTIELLRRVFGFPVSLNLIDVEIDEAGVYQPKAFVVEPDFLFDVSAISECFQPGGPEPFLYLLKKFLPFEVSPPLMLGHIANFFLDQLLADPGLSFQDLFPRVFSQYPLKFCLFEDAEVRSLTRNARGHYQHLKRVIARALGEQGIEAAFSQLEPTFYAEKFGLQGRLDLFHHRGDRMHIVELKSGKVFRPNVYGLPNNHYTQTLLYDLLIRAVNEEAGRKADPTSYILYSRLEKDNLRYAPKSAARQYEALQVRNQLVAIERLLGKIGEEPGDLLRQGDRLFRRLHPGHHPSAGGFFKRDLTHFTEVFSRLEDVERKYIYAFSGFIAREHRLAKVGTPGGEGRAGQAALWLQGFSEKEEAFSILRDLRLADNRAGQNEPELVFQRPSATRALTQFRRGDIALLYPADSGHSRSALRHQVFKGTIVALSPDRLTFRLRSRQFHDQVFHAFQRWNLEPDLLDSSFGGLYRALFAFAGAPADLRSLWLGRRPPAEPAPAPAYAPVGLSTEQAEILGKMLAAEEYFLLWGPPGTGKTSVMLRALVEHLFRHTGESLLLLAFTNRAVDEICRALETVEGLDYLRIGSRFATGPAFRPRLLREKLGQGQNRRALLEVLGGYRVVVGTVASLANKHELFRLKAFDRMVVDEASQILEPGLLGLLSQVPRTILIGDHQQLPAVVVQGREEAEVRDPELRGIGLTNLANALFERLYRRCAERGWTWAYAQLRCQGRMHQDIMAFPSQAFYGGALDILPDTLPQHRRQVAASFLEATPDQPWDELLLSRRVVFLPTEADPGGSGPKTNRYEAALVARIVRHFAEKLGSAEQGLTDDTLGVITPYRAQIAQIKSTLAGEGLGDLPVTVDTVERYQGGARDIVVLSLCTNRLDQLRSLVSLSDEGVDRKLNVAMTRAREQLIVLGNREVLGGNPVYAEFIRRYAVTLPEDGSAE